MIFSIFIFSRPDIKVSNLVFTKKNLRKSSKADYLKKVNYSSMISTFFLISSFLSFSSFLLPSSVSGKISVIAAL